MEQLVQLEELLADYIHIDFVQGILSNPKDKESYSKITIRPVMLKGQLCFQGSMYKKEKVYHQNFEGSEMIPQILLWIKEDFKQLEISTKEKQLLVLVSKKGKITMKQKKFAQKIQQKSLEHNRKKKYLLDPSENIPFLVDLGILTKEGKIVQSKYDKFRQMNRYLEFVEDILPEFKNQDVVRIIDFGCGKSYLTFALYHYLKVVKNYQVEITGLDLKEDVIAHCNELARRYEFDSLQFQVGDIAQYEEKGKVDMVVSLHACDTATDYALEKAVGWGAKVIFAVPCCQHELNGQIQSDTFQAAFQYGLIKERMASLLTDALRGELLSQMGYQVQLLEFIDMEHTPKNILIRGVKREQKKKTDLSDYKKITEIFQLTPTLEKLLIQTGKDN